MLDWATEWLHAVVNSMQGRVGQSLARAVDREYTTDASNLTEFSHELYVDSTTLATALADCSPEHSLEIGCGYGRLTPWIAAHTDDHHAIDSHADRLADAQAEFPDVTFQEARVEDLPYPDECFDFVVTWGVLNHVPQTAIRDAVREIKRVTTPDGTLVISEATTGREDPRWTYRSVEEWTRLFSPRHLVFQTATDRSSEQFRDDAREHVVMKFR